ncbi:MAG: LysR family transcriptional regulator [Rhizobiales bacterium]|nr:LysR family transcriptional regulator [Hyphomicrobiales bacterium]
MKLEWLEDMVALYSAKTLTAAAAKRNVSQPAFSRRIQALEEWLGVALVDRSRKPVTLTAVGRDQETLTRALVASVYEFRAASRSQANGQSHLTIASQHSLSAEPLLELLERHQGVSINATYRIWTGDREDCLAKMISGDADLLFCYERIGVPPSLPQAIAKTLTVGSDQLLAVCTPQLQARLTERGARVSTPILIYPREGFFGDLIWRSALPALMEAREVEIRCVSSFSYGLLDLALSGHGVAWLPMRLAGAALADGRLTPFASAGPPVPLNVVVAITRRRVEELAVAIRELAGLPCRDASMGPAHLDGH